MKTNILKTAIASALLMGSAGVSAENHGNLGDSRIHYPLTGGVGAVTTITTPGTDVWFIAATDADFYTIDLRQNNGNCGHTDEGEDFHKTYVFNTKDPSLQCGMENVKTLFDKGITGYYDETDGDITTPGSEGEADLNLCKWRTPDLANGNYQIAVNSIKLGYHSVTENRFNCLTDAGQAANVAAEVAWAAANTVTTGVAALASATLLDAGKYELATNDTFGKVDRKLPSGDNTANLHRDPSAYTLSNTLIGGDQNYQRFEIAVPVTPPPGQEITQKPNRPVLVSPVNGSEVAATASGGNDDFVFVDDSPLEGQANWYELWITPAEDTTEESRIKDFKANLQYPGWFKVLVDSSELTCTQNPGVGRTCTITLDSPTIKDAPAGTEYHWWVRGYNDEYETGSWSSNVGIFVAD